MHKIASKPENICEIETIVHHLASKFSLCQEVKANLLISLTEAVNNAIIHGNGADENKYVHIHVLKDGSLLSVAIEDEGEGFNPKNLPDPTSPEYIECCGGRGVFLIHQLCDKVEYKKNGARVEISFELPA